MAKNYGKEFEKKVKEDFLEVGDNSIDRLTDSMSRFKAVRNISDFIGYIFPFIYYIECKSTLGNTLNFAKIRQYEDLEKKIGITGVNPGVLIWFIEHGKVVWCDIETIKKMKEQNYKSVNVKKDLDIDGIYVIPSKTLRIYEKCDFNIMKQVAYNNYNKQKGINDERQYKGTIFKDQ